MSEPSNRKYEWEAWMLEEVIPYYENRLIRVANNISKKVIELLEEYRRRENNGAINLGIVVRVRPDTLGPRITWVRFKGKSRNGRNGTKFTPTEPVKLRGKYRYSSRLFAGFPDDIRVQLEEMERNAAYVRFRTERLAELSRLCRTGARFRW